MQHKSTNLYRNFIKALLLLLPAWLQAGGGRPAPSYTPEMEALTRLVSAQLSVSSTLLLLLIYLLLFNSAPAFKKGLRRLLEEDDDDE